MAQFAKMAPRRSWQLVAAWLCLTLTGMAMLWRYEMVPGAVGAVPAQLPDRSLATPLDGTYSLLLAVHPHCPCSRATVRELNRIVARSGSQIRITALIVSPSHMPPDWSHTDIWRDVSAIPNAVVRADVDGKQCESLGAKTSGHVMLYSPTGALIFQGGITSERGHEGDNAGSDAIIAAVSGYIGTLNTSTTTPVFGCPLHRAEESQAACDREGCSR